VRICGVRTEFPSLSLHNIVSPYVSPPTHAVVPSVDETLHIQALDLPTRGCRCKKVAASNRGFQSLESRC
jgi:hypothetical protein